MSIIIGTIAFLKRCPLVENVAASYLVQQGETATCTMQLLEQKLTRKYASGSGQMQLQFGLYLTEKASPGSEVVGGNASFVEGVLRWVMEQNGQGVVPNIEIGRVYEFEALSGAVAEGDQDGKVYLFRFQLIYSIEGEMRNETK